MKTAHHHPVQAEPRSHGEIHHEMREVDLNQAGLEELEDLPMVGEQRAKDLIANRPFRSWQEVATVPGFGLGMIDDLKSGGAVLRSGSKGDSQAKKGKDLASEPRSSDAAEEDGHSAQTTTDQQKIREWAEARGAKPSAVKRTGKGDDPGIIRLDFPGYSGGDSLEEISWEEWFEKFEESKLALLYQEETAGGKTSNFNKLICRSS
jgi:hypothetical protein